MTMAMVLQVAEELRLSNLEVEQLYEENRKLYTEIDGTHRSNQPIKTDR